MAEHAGTGPWQWQRPAQAGDTSIILLGDTNIQDRAEPASVDGPVAVSMKLYPLACSQTLISWAKQLPIDAIGVVRSSRGRSGRCRRRNATDRSEPLG